MNTKGKAAQFHGMHLKGQPVILYNAWDAGAAKTVADAGAPAIATSSWSIAEAQGYRDGENIPLDLVSRIIARITASVDVPVSVDFEGGYTDNDDELARNVIGLLDLGIVGINFEDRLVRGGGLVDIERQSARIAAIRKTADNAGLDLFINARTDLFLGQGNAPSATIDEALDRAQAYAHAGASGFFIPGLQDKTLIARIVDNTPLPINVMVTDGVPPSEDLANIGVARISYGASPYISMLSALRKQATSLYS